MEDYALSADEVWVVGGTAMDTGATTGLA